jgi:hypothetical protein
MMKKTTVDRVCSHVKAGDCVVKAPLYDLAALFTDAEIQARIADKQRERDMFFARVTREMESEFRRMDREAR